MNLRNILQKRQIVVLTRHPNSASANTAQTSFWTPIRVSYSILILLLVAIGCQRPVTKNPGSEGATKSASDMPGIAADASPTDVATAAIVAIEADDNAALLKLLAKEKVQQDVQAITGGRPRFQVMVDKAIPTALTAISSEINHLDRKGREIGEATVTGETALVIVKGMRAGQGQVRRLFLVRENNQWRLVPSHR